MKGVFITGTDTNIGKTVASTILALGTNSLYWKPIQSGLEEETDTEFVSKFLGTENTFEETYRLNSPLSPNHSAQIDGVEICINDFAIPPLKNRSLIIEGAGGVLVPLNSSELIIDLIKKMNFPCIVVAKSGLGTLNHTLLTVEALKKRKIPIKGIILNGDANNKNKESIESFTGVKVILEIPTITDISKESLLNVYKKIETKELF